MPQTIANAFNISPTFTKLSSLLLTLKTCLVNNFIDFCVWHLKWFILNIIIICECVLFLLISTRGSLFPQLNLSEKNTRVSSSNIYLNNLSRSLWNCLRNWYTVDYPTQETSSFRNLGFSNYLLLYLEGSDNWHWTILLITRFILQNFRIAKNSGNIFSAH